MKRFNLNEYFKDINRKVVTREGRQVRIICTDETVASKPMTSVVGRIATDEPGIVWGKDKDLNNFGVSENTTGKGVSPDGSHSKTGGGTPSVGSGDGYEASYPAPSENPMTSVVGVRQNGNNSVVEISTVKGDVKWVRISRYDEDYEDTKANCSYYDIQYLHELQNAMKTCKINKDIEL